MLKMLDDGRIVYYPNSSIPLSFLSGGRLEEGVTVADIIREEAFVALAERKLDKTKTQITKRESKSTARLRVVKDDD